jgi:signal transduction histidine kinase
VEKENQTIIVAAQDSGCGIESNKVAALSEGRSGVGFRGMAERVRYLGGNLSIDSNAAGTIVTATLPLKRPNRSVAQTEVA